MSIRTQSCVLALAATALAAGSSPQEAEPPEREAPVAVAPREPEALSLFGKPLYPLELTAEQQAVLKANLAAAEQGCAQNPDDPESVVWLGRRLAYLGHYQEAIAVYSRGLERWPTSHQLMRHRGHRWITVREFDKAIADLERATVLIRDLPDAIEPDGAPNVYNIPRSTTHSNIWYHLGLAHYLRGDFEAALRCYRECMQFSTNDDMRCATSDWLYMTYRRLGRDDEARRVLEPIHAGMEILENHAYHRRLLMYKGEVPPESLLASTGASDLDLVTQGYGVGNWHLCNGDTAQAKEIFSQMVAKGNWTAFGSIAAECDLARLP